MGNGAHAVGMRQATRRAMGVTGVSDGLDLGAVWTATIEDLSDGIDSAQQRAYLRLTRLRAIVVCSQYQT